ncbi:uncharacterized protein ARMOST_03216 [Armillaria ostoyae]|uniref:Uncharacterized protein n=1 Tax=Armillaria ostoyae TaxID=47428 RepID=A0A284QTU5_ARMOS|nr:uncharacterized protein ARMOST_03216 [Armillaria ostoyae]
MLDDTRHTLHHCLGLQEGPTGSLLKPNPATPSLHPRTAHTSLGNGLASTSPWMDRPIPTSLPAPQPIITPIPLPVASPPTGLPPSEKTMTPSTPRDPNTSGSLLPPSTKTSLDPSTPKPGSYKNAILRLMTLSKAQTTTSQWTSTSPTRKETHYPRGSWATAIKARIFANWG